MGTWVALKNGRSFQIEASYPAVIAAVEDNGQRGLARVHTDAGQVSIALATVEYIEGGGQRWEPTG